MSDTIADAPQFNTDRLALLEDTFEQFHPDRIAQRILGMGDIMSLIEQAESLYEEEEALKLQEKMMSNQFTLQDFLEQLQKAKEQQNFL